MAWSESQSRADEDGWDSPESEFEAAAWEESGAAEVAGPRDEGAWTLRQALIRGVAAAVLLSFVVPLYLTYRGVQDIVLVVAVLIGVAAVARFLRAQGESDDPYGPDEPPSPEIR